mmetsp:Transcript_8349/g.15368  ORF Transcript_8349/g.15368 Transcript_8349/m.15368 type:complete len:111 (-) Transcript_8349:57-389(-)
MGCCKSKATKATAAEKAAGDTAAKEAEINPTLVSSTAEVKTGVPEPQEEPKTDRELAQDEDVKEVVTPEGGAQNQEEGTAILRSAPEKQIQEVSVEELENKTACRICLGY